jgi:hypothetical protein
MSEKHWTRPADLKTEVERAWNKGRLLAARVTGESLYPLRLRLRAPAPTDIGQRFDEVRQWIQQLRAGSREQRGYGYTLQWRSVRHRLHGTNELPAAAEIPSADDALRLIGRQRDSRRFDTLVEATRTHAPALLDWLARRPLNALEQADDWDAILRIITWFRAHPRPGVYLRQLEIPGVDTKFIEARRRLLGELLDAALPPDAIDTRYSGARGFEARYGLLQRPALVRFRVLDGDAAIAGLDDLSVRADQFASLELDLRETPIERVFITENEITGLAFPPIPRSLVIFGRGYAVEQLGQAEWLQRVPVDYWGDLDTHGFAILDRLRQYLPHSRSLLMDRATLDAHQHLWTQEPAERRFSGELARLTADEQALFIALRDNTQGDRIRLEQERIGYSALHEALATVAWNP